MSRALHLPHLSLGEWERLYSVAVAAGGGYVLNRDDERVAPSDELVALAAAELVDLGAVAALVGAREQVPEELAAILARCAAGPLRLLDRALAAHGREHGYQVDVWREYASVTACALA